VRDRVLDEQICRHVALRKALSELQYMIAHGNDEFKPRDCQKTRSNSMIAGRAAHCRNVAPRRQSLEMTALPVVLSWSPRLSTASRPGFIVPRLLPSAVTIRRVPCAYSHRSLLPQQRLR